MSRYANFCDELNVEIDTKGKSLINMFLDHLWLKSLDCIWLGSRESQRFEEEHPKEHCGQIDLALMCLSGLAQEIEDRSAMTKSGTFAQKSAVIMERKELI